MTKPTEIEFLQVISPINVSELAISCIEPMELVKDETPDVISPTMPLPPSHAKSPIASPELQRSNAYRVFWPSPVTRKL